MRIFLELPTWLGDCVMATAAIENLSKAYPDAKITFFGSPVSVALFKNHPLKERRIEDRSRKSFFRGANLYKEARNLGKFDFALSFRGSFYSKLLLFFTDAKRKFQYDKKEFIGHQVEKYCRFVNDSLDISFPAGNLKLYFEKERFDRRMLGLNPGATYGSAKRWYPKEFAKVAAELSDRFDILIFGSSSEREIAKDIEDELIRLGVKNYRNLAGKTSIEELIEKIAGLSLFITNDSGPMHIAAAFKVPTVAIFGPTKYKETSPWGNDRAFIVRKELFCSPCMKRECPLKTHECMKSVTAKEVLDKIEEEKLY